MTDTLLLCEKAKAAAPLLAATDGEKINDALIKMADALIADADLILEANRLDVMAAREKIGAVMIDRLRLDRDRIAAMAEGIREIAKLPSPIGEVLEERLRPNGLRIKKVSVPIGVIAIIYESRPNVTSDAAALSVKKA